jgi:FdhD protein
MSRPASGSDIDVELPGGAPTVAHAVVGFRGGERILRDDELAVEEPLEIRIAGRSLAVTMRTPGHDAELVAGFLHAERVIDGPDDLDVIAHYAGPDDDPRTGNVINVLLRRPGPALTKRLERNFFTSSACGLCGKATIDAIGLDLPPVVSSLTVSIDTLYALEPVLSAAQTTFARTGGLHAAGLFDASGRLLVLREDVGRHNAVDKVVGRMLQDRALPLDRHILLVSGRASFEIIQKALVARIPVVAAVSAPSSMAVHLAQASGMTLVGFLRRGRLNVYAGQERVRSDS